MTISIRPGLFAAGLHDTLLRLAVDDGVDDTTGRAQDDRLLGDHDCCFADADDDCGIDRAAALELAVGFRCGR